MQRSQNPSDDNSIGMNGTVAQGTWAEVPVLANGRNVESALYNQPVNPPSALNVQGIQVAESTPGVCGIKNPYCLGLSCGVLCRCIIAWLLWCMILAAINTGKYDLCKSGDLECTCRTDKYECSGYTGISQIKYDECEDYPEVITNNTCSDTKDTIRQFMGSALIAWIICTITIVWDFIKHFKCFGLSHGCQQYCCLYVGAGLTSALCLMAYINWRSNECCKALSYSSEGDFEQEAQASINLIIFSLLFGLILLVASIWKVEHFLFGKPPDWPGSHMNQGIR